MSTESNLNLANLKEENDDLSLELTLKEEKRLLRRIDLRIVPYASLLYLLSFLDRVNIGQARLAGLEHDLGLHGNQYNTALTIFFVSYVVFEVPSNLLLRKFTPRRWIFFLMVCWSIIQIGMGLVTNVKGLYATRFLLGIFEAGLFPGLNFIFTMWYTRQELSIRVAVFFIGATLSGAFGGILAFGIRQMAGVGGKDGWAWIFILEGLFTLLCAIPALWLIPDFPDTSTMLTPKERTKWLHRLAISQGVTNTPLPFTTRQVTRAVYDWRTYAYTLMYFCMGIPFYSLSLFVPTIIAALGFTNARANLLSAAPYALALPTTIAASYLSDKYMIRGPVVTVSMIITTIGYSILISDVSEAARFVAVFLTVIGITAATPSAITFIGNNFGPMYTRAAAMGVFFSFGNSAGIIASNVYPASEAPRYIKGHSIALAFSVASVFVSLGLTIYNYKENARRDRIYGRRLNSNSNSNSDGSDSSILYIQDEVLLEKYGLKGKTREEIVELGDRHPAFRYTI